MPHTYTLYVSMLVLIHILIATGIAMHAETIQGWGKHQLISQALH